MQVTEQEPIVPSDEADIGPTESEYVLNIAGVYQDLLTRDWAAHVCEQAIQIAGAERIQAAWFEVPPLGRTGDPARGRASRAPGRCDCGLGPRGGRIAPRSLRVD